MRRSLTKRGLWHISASRWSIAAANVSILIICAQARWSLMEGARVAFREVLYTIGKCLATD